jgi:hypothetical protein
VIGNSKEAQARSEVQAEDRLIRRLRPIAQALAALAGLSLECAPSPGPAPPPTDRMDTPRADTPRTVTILKPFVVPEVLPDIDPPPPPPRDPMPPPAGTFPILPATDSAMFDNHAGRLLDTLRGAGSLLEWRRTHWDETIERAQDNREFDGGFGLPLEGAWCARAVRRERLHDGRVVLRSVFFYPPDSVAPAVEGNVPVGLEAIAECRAGAISLESEEPIPALGDSLALAVDRRLTSRYGKGRAGARLATWRAGDWRNSTFWRVPAASVVAAAEGRGWLGRVFMLAWEPSSGISSDLADSQAFRRDPETAMLREIVALGPLDSVQAEGLIALRARFFWAWEGMIPATLTDSMLLSALEPWVSVADTLPSRARSAALLLADRVLEEARLASLLEPDSTALRSRLERSGARFEQHALGGHSYIYVNNWLWEAARLDRDGPIGQRALLVLLRHAFYTGPGCGGEGYRDEEFRRVIAEGERALAGRADPALRPEIERLVADAYGDIVYLASDGGYACDFFQSADYRAEMPEARRKAIEHYDAALRLTVDRLTRTRLGQATWRLRAGLAPLVPHFICVYD